jgi:hypothetical protein
MIEQPTTALKRQRLVKLFEFLKAYTDLRFPAVRDIDKQIKLLGLKVCPRTHRLNCFSNKAAQRIG